MAGRVTLVKSIEGSIPLYPMMVTKIPKQILEDVEHGQRSFIWGHDITERKMHLIRWENIQKPKECGGLGLLNLEDMNMACLMKLVWRLRTEEGGLWIEVLKHKYNNGELFGNDIRVGQNASTLWKDLGKLWDALNNGLWRRLGNGNSTSFWKDA